MYLTGLSSANWFTKQLFIMRGTALAVLVDTFGTVVHVSLPLPVGAVSAYRDRSQCIDEFKTGMHSRQATKDLT